MFAFVPASAVSTLADATERFTEEVCCVVIAALRLPNRASVLEEELEIEFELTFIAPRAPSMLAEELER